MREMITSGVMPVIALRGLAVFPDQTIHFEVGREKSVMALDAAMKKDQMLMLVPQRDITKDDPQLKDRNGCPGEADPALYRGFHPCAGHWFVPGTDPGNAPNGAMAPGKCHLRSGNRGYG